jgi:hypothetical protein
MCQDPKKEIFHPDDLRAMEDALRDPKRYLRTSMGAWERNMAQLEQLRRTVNR